VGLFVFNYFHFLALSITKATSGFVVSMNFNSSLLVNNG